MRKRDIYHIAGLLLSFVCNAQVKDAFIPLKGEIVFSKKEIITDNSALQNSTQYLFKNAEESAAKDNKTDHSATDLKAPPIKGMDKLLHFTLRDR